MKHKINIRGKLIPNDYKWFYDLFEEDSTCPKDVQNVLDAFVDGDEIEVYINSPGGVIDVGSEIYTLLRSKREHVKIYITGEACSAASIVAMSAYCEMSPTALMMVHCVSSGVRGNHLDMEKMAEVLKTADKALSTAYMEKTGLEEDDILSIMEEETWLTAEQAKALGFIDKIMFQEDKKENEVDLSFVASSELFSLPSKEQLEKARNMMKQSETPKDNGVFLLQTKLNLLKLKGVNHE